MSRFLVGGVRGSAPSSRSRAATFPKPMLIVLSAMFLVVVAGAQERNAARLVLADTSYVDLTLGVGGGTGRLRDVFTPASMIQGSLDASARKKLGRVSMYGRFGYGYEYGTGSTWRGWIDPYTTPFMLADSIPGTLSLERYTMEAGAGLPVGDHWSLGLDMAYDVALMAKHKDLRNKNTGMNFKVSPGVYWRSGGFGLGLNLGYERSTERVEYTQIATNVEHILFDVYGLWVCHGSGYASAENRRLKTDNRLSGGFQFDWSQGRTALHNELRVSWLQSVQTEVGYNDQQFGSTRSLTWEDDLSLDLGPAHALEASFIFSSMQGFRPLQRQELDPDSRIRVWVTYGDPVFCYWRQYHVEELRYRFGTSWKLLVGLQNWGVEHSYTEYPQRFVQHICTLTPSVSVEIPVGRFLLVPWLGYSYDYNAYTDNTSWQLSEPLLRQWDFWDGNNYLGAFDLQWSTASGRTCIRAHYGIESSTRLDGDGVRHTASLTVGFVF